MTGTSSPNSPSYRGEARPFVYAHLFQFQKDALEWLLTRIDAAIERATTPHTQSQGSSLVDDERRNQVLFVSGVRGSGKTSIPLSLQRMIETPGDAEPRHKDQLLRARQHTVWLETLDLDPWPEGSNPMIAILARIEQAVRDLLPGATQELLTEGSPAERAFNTLARLQTDLALSWDGSPAPQGHYTDADQYATDVRRAEDARLRLNHRFQEVLTLLSKALERVRGPGALFVLAIDDFDLNPGVSFDVLRIIRRLSSPHFLVIVLGDLHIAENVFELVLNRQLREAGGLRPGDRHPLLEARVGSTSSAEIAANAIRKLLPPAQRFEIGNLTYQEALKFKPSLQDKTLGALLRELPMTIEQKRLVDENEKTIQVGGIEINTLYHFLFLTVSEERSIKYEPWEPRYRSAIEFLSAPARHVVDLWHMFTDLMDVLPEQRTQPIARRLAEWTRMTVQEDANLSAEERTDILGGIRWDVIEQQWDVHFHCLKLKTARSEALRLDREEPALFNLPCEIYARQFWRWHFESKRLKDDETYSQPLSDRTASAIKILHDFLHLTESGRVEPKFRDDEIHKRAYAEWHVPKRPPVEIPWFSSVWPTFWEFSIFAQTWNQFCQTAERVRRAQSKMGDQELIQFLALGWIVAGATTLTGTVLPHNFSDFFKKDSNPSLDDDQWRQAARWVNEICGEFGQRRTKNRDDMRTNTMSQWLVNLALLLSPEAGLAFQDKWVLNEKFWETAVVELTTQWKNLSPNIRDQRAKRLGEAALSNWGEDVLKVAHPLNASNFKPENEIYAYIPQRYRDVKFPRAVTDNAKGTYYPSLKRHRSTSSGTSENPDSSTPNAPASASRKRR